MSDVLLVEDEIDIQALLRETLEREGIPARLAASGQAALQAAAADWPAVIVLDLTLPDLDGWQVWDELRSRADGRPLRVILFSASLDRAGEAKAAEWEALAVLKKPVAPSRLVKEIRRALASPHLHRTHTCPGGQCQGVQM